MKKLQSVLVVDDSEGEHLIARFAIEDFDESVEVASAYDGEQALQILQQMAKPPDLILLDINMPGMGGLEFLQEYSKASPENTVVAMLSSSDQRSDKQACLQYKFVRQYIVKPLETLHLHTLAENFFS